MIFSSERFLSRNLFFLFCLKVKVSEIKVNPKKLQLLLEIKKTFFVIDYES